MDDIIRKALLFGVGVTAITKEKTEKLLKEVQKKHNIKPNEAKKMVNDLMKESDKKTKEIAKFVHKHVSTILGEAAATTKKELTDLEKRLKSKAKKGAKKAVKKGKRVAKKAVKKAVRKVKKKKR